LLPVLPVLRLIHRCRVEHSHHHRRLPDALRTLPDCSVHCVVTSPPYFGLRDYGVNGQIGLEPTPEAFVAEMVAVFREVRRVLRDDGTLWLNLGDSYANDSKWTRRQSGGKQACKSALQRPQRHRPAQAAPALKQKDLIGAPWMVAFAFGPTAGISARTSFGTSPILCRRASDRCTKAHEYFFLSQRATGISMIRRR
jgi:hypothetical protein